MSIPLDRLYHYIKTTAEKIHKNHVLIYRFLPHGSKKIEDLQLTSPLPKQWKDCKLAPEIFCNDQEPLNYNLYRNAIPDSNLQKIYSSVPQTQYNGSTQLGTNLWTKSLMITIWDYVLLLHSEKRSRELDLYKKSNFIPVYYWNHALLARDWFRYAKYTTFCKHTETKLFLIYNRVWSGTREYRLKFTDELIKFNLQQHCQLGINPIDPDTNTHYTQHVFSNSNWKPCNELENYFPINKSHSHCSADFDCEDYNSTRIEVVLETIFDDDRLHLTEKILRPIACGQPFILVSTVGSLEYLHEYGFKTFHDCWDENYNQIQDPQQRLDAIITLMKQISQWDSKTQNKKIMQAQQIAEFNRKHFFSDKFFNQVCHELKINLTSGFGQLEKINSAGRLKNLIEACQRDPLIINSTDHEQQVKSKIKTVKDNNYVLNLARKYNLNSLSRLP